MWNRLTPIVATVLLAAAVFAPALAQAPAEPEKPKLGWADQGELAWALTTGNADSNTISLANTLEYRWPDALFKFYVFGIRAKSEDTLRFYYDRDGDGSDDYRERDITNVSAERYVLALNFEDKISARMYWFAAAGWERNEPAGIDSRVVVGGGVGNIWYENDGGHFKTSYGLNYTWENLSETSENYVGANVTADWLWKFSPNASFQTVDTLFLDFDEMDNWRISSNNSLTVQMNKMLAVKVGLTLLYDNQPAPADYTVYNENFEPVDDSPVEGAELDELDTIFTTSLVIGF